MIIESSDIAGAIKYLEEELADSYAHEHRSADRQAQIDEMETRLTALYLSLKPGVTSQEAARIAYEIEVLDEVSFLDYLSRFPSDAVVGQARHGGDCVMHRYLRARYRIRRSSLFVDYRSTVLTADDHTKFEATLPGWAAHIAGITSEGAYEETGVAVTAGALRVLLGAK